MSSSKRVSGTSLIEILVVIVVFLIGILAVIQIFPGGFKVLRETRNLSMANGLVRSEIARSKARLGQLPDMILPVVYSFTGSTVNIAVDTNRTPGDLGPTGDGLDGNGHFTLAGSDIGYWPYLVGANVMRRVVGEGGPVPAPRPVGNDFGGLMLLQYAPIVYNAAYPALFQVYGNDMVKLHGAPFNINFVRRNWQYYLEDADDPAANLYLPRNPTKPIVYRLALSAWVLNGGNTQTYDFVDQVVNVAAGTGYQQVPLASLITNFQGAEFDSVRVARAFDLVTAFTADAYEYKLLDPSLGLILFNPAGYNATEPRSGGRRLPLQARVSYDVYDWRILREEFRVPDGTLPQYRLPAAPLVVSSEIGQDGRRNTEFAFGEPPENDVSNLLLLDMDTGGLVLERSQSIQDAGAPRRLVQVNRSLGVIQFLDRDRDPSNGLQGEVLYPGASTATVVDLGGRAVRALYQARGEWAVQVMKAPSVFYRTYGPPGVAQYYVARSNDVSTIPTRIYFPKIDLGKKVVIGEIWYLDGAGNQRLIQNQDFVIQGTPADPFGYPYIDIRSAAPDAAQFDLRPTNMGGRGYAVRRVKGATITVRALFNPAYFSLRGTNAENLENFDKWMRTWKRVTTETYIQRGEF